VNKQVVDLSDELARKVEDTLRQQEEISSLLAQIVDLQARCKRVSDHRPNEAKAYTHLNAYPDTHARTHAHTHTHTHTRTHAHMHTHTHTHMQCTDTHTELTWHSSHALRFHKDKRLKTHPHRTLL
jgi:carbohydrate-binding DOMON domain-containing protein